MDNKINDRIIYGIIYGIIIFCIIGIILVFVFSTGNKVLDLILVGILAFSVYLINKNIADDKDLYPEIYNKIKEDRDRAIEGNFQHDFVQEFIESDDTELDGEELDEHTLKTLKKLKTYSKFLSTTNNYLNYLNNKVSIEEYFKDVLPFFNYTEDKKDDLKKNIIKYVVFYYFPNYNKKGVVKPLNYKKLVYLYIKDNTDINNEMIENRTKYYVDIVLETVKVFKPHLKTVKNAQIIINNLLARTELRIAYSTLKTNDEKEIFINYINELLGNYNNKVGITDFIADKKTAKVAPDPPYSGSADDKDLYPEIYNKIKEDRDRAQKHTNFNEEFNQYFKGPTFLSTTEKYLNSNELSIEEYFKDVLPFFNYTEDKKDDLKKNIIKYVVFYYLPTYNKVGVEKPHNYKILVDLYIKNKIKNEVDSILQEQRDLWTRSVFTNLQAFTTNARTRLNTMYNEFGNKYEKEILIAYIEELLKDVKENKDVEEKNKIINYIQKMPIYHNHNLN